MKIFSVFIKQSTILEVAESCAKHPDEEKRTAFWCFRVKEDQITEHIADTVPSRPNVEATYTEKVTLKIDDPVAHPSHYNAGKIEVIEAIEDWGLGFHLGNVVKYVARAGKKDPNKEIEDLEKAAWYLRRKIEILKSTKEGRDPVRPNDMKKG